MKRFIMYRPQVPATHTEFQKNAPDKPQFEGVLFDDGKVVVHWLTAGHSISIWDSLDDMLVIHGHPEYDSKLVWVDE